MSKRLAKDDRRRQMLETAAAIVRAEGTDALTLASLAERAGVTKPIAYDHFGTREGLLMALYRHYASRQEEIARAALAESGRSLAEAARILAAAYVDCVLDSGPEFAALSAALSASHDMVAFRQQARERYVAQYREALAPFSGRQGKTQQAIFTGLIGAADALATAAASGQTTRERAVSTLASMIVSALR